MVDAYRISLNYTGYSIWDFIIGDFFFALSYIFDSNTHQRNYFLYCPVLLV